MADYKLIIPWIKKWEGGLSKDPNDQASKNPVPDGSGYHTNKGITWQVWKSVFGSSEDSIKRFYDMSDKDWAYIFKTLYWDKIGGDNIRSQRIADILSNWAWGSGTYIPSVAIQKILGIGIDGIIGKQTINAINSANEQIVFTKLKNANIAFFDSLSKNPKYSTFRTGWFNRLTSLYDEYIKKNTKPIVLFAFLVLGVILISNPKNI